MKKKSDNKICLNCEAAVTGKFCPDCGQSIETHRFQLLEIIKHDFLKKVFYYDKGLFYSIKELLTRPGHSVREYIEGKRVKHLSYISLIIILILCFKLIEEVTPFHYASLTVEDKEIVDHVEQFLKSNAKLFYLGLIPFYALFSFLFFRKAGLNYSEHFVINTFRASAFLLFNIIFLVVASFLTNITVLLIINRAVLYITLVYGTWFYYQYFSPYYTNKFLLGARSFFAVMLPMLLVVIIAIVYLNYLPL